MQVTDTANSVSKSVIKSISLVLGLGLLTISLLSFAVINWVAANWSNLSTDTRLVLVQLIFTLSILIAFLACWRYKKLADYTIQFAALATGALLALIGQIYQTGADVWLLFALWAVLITPWMVLLRTIFITLLWALLINITIILYVSSSPVLMLWLFDNNLLLIIVNTVLLVAVLCLQKFMQDDWRLLRKVFAIAALSFLFLYVLQNQFEGFNSPQLLIYLLSSVALVLTYIWFTKVIPDLLIISAVFLTAIGIFSLLVLQLSEDILGILLIAVFIVIATFLASLKLLKLWRSWYPHKSESKDSVPWYFYLLRIVALTLAALIFTAWYMFTFDMHSINDLEYLSWALLVIGLLIAKPVELRQARNAATGTSLIYEAALVLVIAGLGIYLVTWLIDTNETFDNPGIWLLLLVALVSYIVLNNFISRFASASLLIIACLWQFNANQFVLGDLPEFLWPISASYFLSLFLVAAFYLWSRQANKDLCRPVVAALFVGVVILAMAMDIINSKPIWQWPLPAIVASLAPGLMAWYFALDVFKQTKIGAPRAYMVAALLLLACLGIFNAFTLLVAVSLLAFAVLKNIRTLAVFSIVLMLAGLVLYYFQQSTSLDFKALQFALVAVLLFITVLLLRSGDGLGNNVFYLRVSKTYLFVLLAGLILVIGFAQYQIRSYQNILQNGVKAILQLAPVDPRSLMQGDYMQLNYALRTEANHLLLQSNDLKLEENKTYWLVLTKDSDNIAQLYAVSDSWSDAKNLRNENPELIILRATLRSQNLDWGANSWFFTEGSGDKYAAAEYGVLSIDDNGQALISGLLDDGFKYIK